MSISIEAHKQFKALQPELAEHVRELVPRADEKLKIDTNRPEGSYLFRYADREAWTELTPSGEITVLVSVAKGEPMHSSGSLHIPYVTAEVIARLLTTDF
jgi:hypothetical protein